MRRGPGQQVLAFRTHGGARAGAGRPPRGERAELPHARRERLTGREPVHVTVRVVRELEGLRHRAAFADLAWALRRVLARDDFRVCHVSLQRTHLHLVVETASAKALADGVRALLISLARALNRRRGRRGRAFVDRYHAHVLRTPQQVRHTLGYVFNNWRKHGEDRAAGARGVAVDPFSSAIAFPPWRRYLDDRHTQSAWRRGALPVAWPETWLLTRGWQRAGAPPSPWRAPTARPR